MLFAHRPDMSGSPSLLCLSASLKSARSSTRLNGIAARVVRELRDDDVSEDGDHFIYSDDGDNYTDSATSKSDSSDRICEPEEEEEEEFEFSFACKEPTASPVSADEIFSNGKIKPLYSISVSIPVVLKKTDKRAPLRILLTEERDLSLSCSSSEADNLEALPPGTYCVWKPKTESSSSSTEDSCRKSKSTGTSRRWKLRNLLRRSKSDGTNSLVIYAKKENDNRDHQDKSKRRALNLVGVLSNVNGLSRKLRPF